MIPTKETVSENTFNGRIAGGIPATLGQFPYLASLQVQGPIYNGHICGASIINNRWLLTGGNCLAKQVATSLSVRVGSTTYRYGGVLHRVAQIRIHPQYIDETRVNDLGLVQTIDFIQFNQFTQAIQPGYTQHGIIGGQVAGWGKTVVCFLFFFLI